MKKLLQILFIGLCMILKISAVGQIPDCNAANGYGTREKLLYYGDLRWDYNVYAYEEHERAEGVANFLDRFKYSPNGVDIMNSWEDLTVPDIDKMLHVDIQPIFNPATDHSAIRMRYGMEVINDIPYTVIIFEPIVLTPTIPDTPRKYKIVSSNVFYRLDNGILTQFQNPVDVQTLMDYYKNNIYVKHLLTGGLRPFRQTGIWRRRDSKSTIIPIQQLLQMYCDNIQYATGSIRFQMIANNYYKTPGGRIHRYKVHVVAYVPNSLQDDVHNPNYLNCGADYTQMCPPNCHRVWINYYGNDPNDNTAHTINRNKKIVMPK